MLYPNGVYDNKGYFWAQVTGASLRQIFVGICRDKAQLRGYRRAKVLGNR